MAAVARMMAQHPARSAGLVLPQDRPPVRRPDGRVLASLNSSPPQLVMLHLRMDPRPSAQPPPQRRGNLRPSRIPLTVLAMVWAMLNGPAELTNRSVLKGQTVIAG